MGKGQRNYVTAVDVGSSKTCVLVAEATDAGLRYAAHAVAESRGSRKGVIVDLKKAVESVQKAATELEETTGIPVEHVVAGVAGAHLRGVNSRGGIALGARAREVTRDDVRQAVERARAISLPDDRQLLHLLP